MFFKLSYEYSSSLNLFAEHFHYFEICYIIDIYVTDSPYEKSIGWKNFWMGS